MRIHASICLLPPSSPSGCPAGQAPPRWAAPFTMVYTMDISINK